MNYDMMHNEHTVSYVVAVTTDVTQSNIVLMSSS